MSELPSYVIDTNTLLSAVLSKDGNNTTALAFQKVLKKGVLLASDETFAELADVIFRSKFDKYLSDEKRWKFLSEFRKLAVWVEITEHVEDCRDKKDNKFLSLALAANATLIISGDQDLLTLHPYKNIPIITARQFIDDNPL
jgi:putative PIN family toxin of toxin-antitoxin system